MSGETREVALGACDCPGAPHADGDVAWLKQPDALRYGDVRRIGAAYMADLQASDRADGGSAMGVFMWRALAAWNKVRLDPRGGGRAVPAPITLESIDDLSPDQAAALIPVLNEFPYLRLIVGDDRARQVAGPVAEAGADAPVGSVQASPGNGLAEPAADASADLPLAAVPPPNPSSGSSPDGSAASTPSTISSASPAPS